MASEKKQLQLIHERYDEYTVRRTIGIFTDANELFRAACAETCPETDLIVYELCPGRADRELKLIWNKSALQDTKFDGIVYVAVGYEDKLDKISEIHAKIKTLHKEAEEKKHMLTSLMNLEAKNTKAPASKSELLASFISNSAPRLSNNLDIAGPAVYQTKLEAQVLRLQYINHMLDEWIVDMKVSTGFDGELSELVKDGTYKNRVPVISFP